MKGIQVSSNEEPINYHKVNNVFFPSLNQRYDIIMCLLILTVFSGDGCAPWASCFKIFSTPGLGLGLGLDQTNYVYRNDDQGRVYQNCKCHDPKGWGSDVSRGHISHYSEYVFFCSINVDIQI